MFRKSSKRTTLSAAGAMATQRPALVRGLSESRFYIPGGTRFYQREGSDGPASVGSVISKHSRILFQQCCRGKKMSEEEVNNALCTLKFYCQSTTEEKNGEELELSENRLWRRRRKGKVLRSRRLR